MRTEFIKESEGIQKRLQPFIPIHERPLPDIPVLEERLPSISSLDGWEDCKTFRSCDKKLPYIIAILVGLILLLLAVASWAIIKIQVGVGPTAKQLDHTEIVSTHLEEQLSTTFHDIFTQQTDCAEIFETYNRSGVYNLQPKGSAGFDAYCDQGWTIIIKRFDGSKDFYLYWDDYKNGFGNKSAEHWLGNDNIYGLTNQGNYTLRLEFTYWNTKQSFFAEYSYFKVANETNKYRLSVSGYRGNSGYDALGYHNNQSFSTRDRDNDWDGGGSCAQFNKGGFWYRACRRTNPTGPYQNSRPCIYWNVGYSTCTSAFTMKMKAL